jgi:hypothetical protein
MSSGMDFRMFGWTSPDGTTSLNAPLQLYTCQEILTSNRVGGDPKIGRETEGIMARPQLAYWFLVEKDCNCVPKRLDEIPISVILPRKIGPNLGRICTRIVKSSIWVPTRYYSMFLGNIRHPADNSGDIRPNWQLRNNSLRFDVPRNIRPNCVFGWTMWHRYTTRHIRCSQKVPTTG